jgi:phage terminase large subunit
MSDLDTLAAATYGAMIALPPYAMLANTLLAARTKAERAAALDAADVATHAEAFDFIAQPEGTRERDRRLSWLRADPRRIEALKHHYRADHYAEFIADWMTVTDPRRVARSQTAVVPFTLWPAQRGMVAFIIERILRQEPGVIVKSRDVGATSVCIATLAACCIFREDFAAGVISSTEAKLDRYADTIFQKLRGLLRSLPPEFRAGYDEQRTDMYLSIRFPTTRSAITGATGPQAFRGSRQSVVLVDEAAYLVDSQAIDSALAAVSDARIDVSTPHGIGGSFYDRAHNANISRLDLTWREDPRRDQAWYDKQVATLDPVVLAQEVNADFSASRAGVVIAAMWAQSSIRLAEKLGLQPAGTRIAALDLGDTGDRSALAVRHGVNLLHVESWSGAGSDLMKTVARAFVLCDHWNVTELIYDGDGLGASVKGDARVLNEARERDGRKPINVTEYRGSSSPVNPTRQVPRTDRKWQDLAANRKAQSWWHLRMLFEQSHHAGNGEPHNADEIICIDPKIPELSRLLAELSQPTMSENSAGKLLIDKLGDGERSPNLADAVVMAFAPADVKTCFFSAGVSEAITRALRGVPVSQFPLPPRGGSSF